MSAPAPPPDGLLRIATAPLALPAGLRDLLPPRAAARRALARTMLTGFERFGYELVVPPAYEREEVVARGMSARARADLVRFVEPESGDLVALRPDMTPQIARIAATRYRDAVGPLRLMYEGSVVRRPRGRARRQRQIAQAGIECIGWEDPAADVEVIRAAGSALGATGVGRWRVELGHAAIAHELLRGVPEGVRDLVTEALAARDTAMLARLLGDGFAPDAPIASVIELAGDVSVLDRAERVLPADRFGFALRALRETVRALESAGLGERVLIDLAEVRGHGYYTGVAFQFLADGPGEPLGAGGRYDSLLARYGVERAATGCALDLEHVEWAVEAAGASLPRPPPRAAIGGEPTVRAPAAETLRSQGLSVAETPARTTEDVLGFARQGGYDAAFFCTTDGVLPLDVTTGALGAPRTE